VTIRDIGNELVQASEEEQFSAQRGLMDELFPFVFEASKRMSARAISRWLEERGTKLSAVTVAKALKNPQKYWESLWDVVEPAARLFANAHKETIISVLTNPDLFTHLRGQDPYIAETEPFAISDAIDEIRAAAYVLEDSWFRLSNYVRESCLSSVDLEGEQEPEEKKEDLGHAQ
jgi:hypothetical protein